MPSSYQIRLFGQPAALHGDGRPVSGLGLGKPLALLSYLLVEGSVPRETLIALLWGDVPEAKARNAFRQALHRLRGALGENVIPHESDSLRIAESAGMETDVTLFERGLDSNDLEQAITEYRGDFLLGLNVREAAFDSWQDARRKKYKARYRDALRLCVQRDLESGDVPRALERAGLLAQSERSDADAAILLATTLLGAGRRAEALDALDQFETRFEEEVGGKAPLAIREFSARLRRSPATPELNHRARTRAGFVGREAELGLLLTQFRAVSAGRASIVILEGESGTGKTRLVNEFFQRCRDIGTPQLLYGRERSGRSAIAYASLGDALRGALDAPGISGTGQHLLAEAARLLPQLRDQFSLPDVGDISDEAGTMRFFEGVAALLDGVAYEQPVCIALDDFQNCSTATFALAHYLVDRLRSAPILFLIAGRSGTAFSDLRDRFLDTYADAAISRDEETARPLVIALGGLAEPGARTLALECLGPLADSEMVERVVAGSGGLPYRIEELSRLALAGDPLALAPVPLRDLLWVKLQRCTQAEQRLFVAAALLDRPVPIRLLAAASHLPEKSALDAALALERAGLLLQSREGMIPAHDFSMELALDGTGPAGLALLAGWAADAVELDGSGSPAELANLFRLAGRRDRSFRYSRAAAHDAIAVGAIDEGLRHLEAALAIAPSDVERGEIISLLRSLRGGLKQLAGETSVDEAADVQPPPTIQKEEAAAGAAIEEIGNYRRSRNAWLRRLRLSGREATIIGAAIVFVAVTLAKGIGWPAGTGAPGISLADSLIIGRELDQRDTLIEFTTGPLGSPLRSLAGATIHGPRPSWIDSMRLPWTNPLVSPDGRRVAVERITKFGSDLYVISKDRRDTVALDIGQGDDFADGWSPDSRWVLSTHGEVGRDGAYGSSLYAYSVNEKSKRIAFDTSSAHAAAEAAWSPDGSHVAWTSRVGQLHQQDIFIGDADGRNAVNVTNDPGEDYSIAWSPDGGTLVFTSERSGKAELYSLDVATRRIRRLTSDGAHADHAMFSPDGRWLAYESTRGGNPSVYVMPAFGGTGRSVAAAQERVTLLGWRGKPVSYIDRFAFAIPNLANPGDSGDIEVRALDRRGLPLLPAAVRFIILDSALVKASLRPVIDSLHLSTRIRLFVTGKGLARVAISAGNWRADTAFIPIGQETLALVHEDFESGLNKSVWRTLGDPVPQLARARGANGSAALLPNGDREWESGLLSSKVFPVSPGLSVEALVQAPFAGAATSAGSLEMALVAADPAEVLDSVAPQFLRLARVAWLGDAGRLSYSVGREIFTEPITRLSGSSSHLVRISIGDDDLVSFFVDGVRRWKSSLRVRTSGDNSRAQLWLASQATGAKVSFDEVSVQLRLQRSTGNTR
jgi:DNA-binding SARP family transcriptional activator